MEIVQNRSTEHFPRKFDLDDQRSTSDRINRIYYEYTLSTFIFIHFVFVFLSQSPSHHRKVFIVTRSYVYLSRINCSISTKPLLPNQEILSSTFENSRSAVFHQKDNIEQIYLCFVINSILDFKNLNVWT